MFQAWFKHQPCERSAVICPILQMGKLNPETECDLLSSCSQSMAEQSAISCSAILPVQTNVCWHTHAHSPICDRHDRVIYSNEGVDMEV